MLKSLSSKSFLTKMLKQRSTSQLFFDYDIQVEFWEIQIEVSFSQASADVSE